MFPPRIKLTANITEILLKALLSTITLTTVRTHIRRYLIYGARRVSGMTLIRYFHRQKIGEPNILEVFRNKLFQETK